MVLGVEQPPLSVARLWMRLENWPKAASRCQTPTVNYSSCMTPACKLCIAGGRASSSMDVCPLTGTARTLLLFAPSPCSKQTPDTHLALYSVSSAGKRRYVAGYSALSSFAAAFQPTARCRCDHLLAHFTTMPDRARPAQLWQATACVLPLSDLGGDAA